MRNESHITLCLRNYKGLKWPKMKILFFYDMENVSMLLQNVIFNMVKFNIFKNQERRVDMEYIYF